MSKYATFTVTADYSLDRSLIPEDSYLNALLNFSDEDENESIKCDNSDIIHAINYLVGDMLPIYDNDLKSILDYFGVYPYSSYDQIFDKEFLFRNNMYNPEFEDHPMNADLRYELIRIDEETFDKLIFSNNIEREDLLFKKERKRENIDLPSSDSSSSLEFSSSSEEESLDITSPKITKR